VQVARTEPLANEVRHFLDCIDDYGQPLTDGAEGLRVLQVLEDAQLSMKEGLPTFGCEKQEYPDWVELIADALENADEELPYTVHPLAEVETEDIGEGTVIWRWTHIMPRARIGEGCMIGQGCFIGANVVIGDGCRIQNGAQLFEGVTLGDRVFIGPGVVFTNDRHPKLLNSSLDYGWLEKTLVRNGATIGANATIRCGVTIGEGATIGAGAVVTKDVPNLETWVGNPARLLR